jgi:hypothetical protein
MTADCVLLANVIAQRGWVTRRVWDLQTICVSKRYEGRTIGFDVIAETWHLPVLRNHREVKGGTAHFNLLDFPSSCFQYCEEYHVIVPPGVGLSITGGLDGSGQVDSSSGSHAAGCGK